MDKQGKKKGLGKKHVIIWASVSAGVLLLVWMLCAVILKVVSNTTAAPMTKYAKKAEQFIEPEEHVKTMEDPSKIGGILKIRSMLDDSSVVTSGGEQYKIPAFRMNIDTAVIFSAQKGDTELSYGRWVCVYNGDPQNAGVFDAIGLLNANKLAEHSSAAALLELLEQEPEGKIRLDEYGENGYIYIPSKISVLDKNDNVLGQVDFGPLPDGCESKKADDIFAMNKKTDNEFDNGDTFLTDMLRQGATGNRKVDEKARKILGQLSYASDIDGVVKNSYGIGSITVTSYGVSAGYAMVYVQTISLKTFFLAVSGAFLAVWTILYWGIAFLIRGDKRRK